MKSFSKKNKKNSEALALFKPSYQQASKGFPLTI
jgi:hypothetical protein